MEKIKRITRLFLVTLIASISSGNSNAQVYKNLDVTSGSGTLVMCSATTYVVTFILPAGYTVYANSSYYTWANDNKAPDCVAYGTNQVSLCLSSGTSTSASIVAYSGGTPFDFTANFNTLSTTITPSAYSPYCSGATPSYTVSCNTQGTMSSPSWTVPPSIMTITSGSGTTSISTSTEHKGNGFVECTVLTTDGCNSDPGLTGSYQAVVDSGTPAAPGSSLVYVQDGRLCQYNANVYDLGATAWRWGKNTSFTSTYCPTTTTGTTTEGPFNPSTNYTIYVEVQNACSSTTWSTYTTYNKTTNGNPPGCIESPIRPSEQVVTENDYKIYPNPASARLTIEYPNSSGTNLSLMVYDMLGHKVTEVKLPGSEGMVDADISNIPSGLYLYVIYSGNNIEKRGKIMIQR